MGKCDIFFINYHGVKFMSQLSSNSRKRTLFYIIFSFIRVPTFSLSIKYWQNLHLKYIYSKRFVKSMLAQPLDKILNLVHDSMNLLLDPMTPSAGDPSRFHHELGSQSRGKVSNQVCDLGCCPRVYMQGD
jgi:hypothetical protein